MRRITTRADDERDLQFLKLAAKHGALEAGRRMGMTNGAACGFLHRIRRADAALPDSARRKKNQNRHDIP